MKIDINRGLGELVLIFVGITLALSFENWNTDRERRNQELSLLSELSQDLGETKEDLVEDDISQALRTEEFSNRLIGYLRGDESNLASETELSGFFRLCVAGVGVVPKRAAYESLKSIGLDLVSDNQIRTSVTNIYELTLARITTIERNLWEMSYAFCIPYYFNYYKISEAVSISQSTEIDMTYAEPKDLVLMREDGSLLLFAIRMRFLLRRQASLYQQLVTEIDEVRSLIASELET